MSLRLADEHGELIESLDQALELIVRLRDHVEQLQRKAAGDAHVIGDLKRDKLRDAEANARWPIAMKWHAFHNKVTGRSSRWKIDCFERAEPFLKAYGYEVCCAASEGIAADHYEDKRSNGTERHHTTWKVLLRDTDRFEEAVNSAPVTTLAKLREEGKLPGEQRKKKTRSPARESTQTTLEDVA